MNTSHGRWRGTAFMYNTKLFVATMTGNDYKMTLRSDYTNNAYNTCSLNYGKWSWTNAYH